MLTQVPTPRYKRLTAFWQLEQLGEGMSSIDLAVQVVLEILLRVQRQPVRTVASLPNLNPNLRHPGDILHPVLRIFHREKVRRVESRGRRVPQ